MYLTGLLIFVVVLGILEQMGIPDKFITWSFVFFAGMSFTIVGFLSRTMKLAEFYVAGQNVPAVYNGMATAASWISGAIFVGLAGIFYSKGHDGIAWVTGWTGGFVLTITLIAPALRKFGAWTVSDFLEARFGGKYAGLPGIIVLLTCSFTYLIAQMTAMGIVASRFLGMEFSTAVFFGLAGILLCSLLGGMRAVTWTQVAQYIVLAVAYLLPVVWISAKVTGFPLPQIMYGDVLQSIAVIEQNLVENSAAISGGLATTVTPDQSLDTFNFLALIFCLMCGTAVFPQLIMRFLTSTSVQGTRRSISWSMFFIVLIFVTAPAYSAFIQFELYQGIIGQPISQLVENAAWLFRWGAGEGQSLVSICGAQALNIEDIRQACGNKQHVISPSDISIDPQILVLAIADIFDLPFVITALIGVGAIAAIMSTTNGLVITITAALGHNVYYRLLNPRAPSGRRLIVTRFIMIIISIIAALITLAKPGDIPMLVAWSFSLAGAGLFPVLVLGIWWKRTTTAGAISGMASGFLITLFYLVQTGLYGMNLWTIPTITDQGIATMASAVIGIPVGFLVMIVVSLFTSPPPFDVLTMMDDIHRPGGKTITQGGDRKVIY